MGCNERLGWRNGCKDWIRGGLRIARRPNRDRDLATMLHANIGLLQFQEGTSMQTVEFEIAKTREEHQPSPRVPLSQLSRQTFQRLNQRQALTRDHSSVAPLSSRLVSQINNGPSSLKERSPSGHFAVYNHATRECPRYGQMPQCYVRPSAGLGGSIHHASVLLNLCGTCPPM